MQQTESDCVTAAAGHHSLRRLVLPGNGMSLPRYANFTSVLLIIALDQYLAIWSLDAGLLQSFRVEEMMYGVSVAVTPFPDGGLQATRLRRGIVIPVMEVDGTAAGIRTETWDCHGRREGFVRADSVYHCGHIVSSERIRQGSGMVAYTGLYDKTVAESGTVAGGTSIRG